MGFNKAGVCVITRTNRPRFSKEGGGWHAERRVMAEAAKKGVVKVLICRVSPRTGKLRPIDPCPECQAIADKLGVIIETVPAE
jgi:hypothetical protein